MINLEEIQEAIKVLLKHRRIKSNSEKNLFSAVIKDIFKHIKDIPEYSFVELEEDPFIDIRETTIEQEILDTKVVIDKFLRYLMSDDVVDQLDMETLAKFNLDVSIDVIINIISSFKFTWWSAGKTFIIAIRNSKVPEKKDSLLFNTSTYTSIDADKIIGHINEFINDTISTLEGSKKQ